MSIVKNVQRSTSKSQDQRETIKGLFQRIIQCPRPQSLPNPVWLYRVLFLSNYRQQKPLAHIKKEIIDETR